MDLEGNKKNVSNNSILISILICSLLKYDT